jgi:nucleoside transporter
MARVSRISIAQEPSMASSATLNPDSLPTSSAPPLEMGVRIRLSIMMFLQFAVWGSYFTVWNIYLGTPVSSGGLGFVGAQIGSLYSTMALGAIISMMIAGQLADRVLSSEYLMAIFHLVGAGLLYAMAKVHDYNTLWYVSLAFALCYNPTLAIANSLAFHNIKDATRDFPTLRVLGTIGWICAGLSVGFLLPAGSNMTNRPLILAAVLSVVLGLFSLALPHTPPTGKKGDAIPFLRAFKLLATPSFGIFFAISFVITIALAFYYTFASPFLKDMNIHPAPEVVMTYGQWSEIFFMLMLPFALKKFGMKGVLTVGMAAWAARYGAFATQIPWLIIVGVALHGVCFDFFLAAGFIYTDNEAPKDIRGSAQALFSFLTYGVGMTIGNILSGHVVDHFTVAGTVRWSSVWLVPSIGAGICLVLFLLLWRDDSGKVKDEVIGAAALIPETPATAPDAGN